MGIARVALRRVFEIADCFPLSGSREGLESINLSLGSGRSCGLLHIFTEGQAIR
jgi:hypothetical protein